MSPRVFGVLPFRLRWRWDCWRAGARVLANTCLPGTTRHSAQSRLSSPLAMRWRGLCWVAKMTLTHPWSAREPLVLREAAARVRPQAKMLELRGDGAVLA